MKQTEVQKTNITTLKSKGLKKKSTQSTFEHSIWTICPQAKDKFSKQILNSNLQCSFSLQRHGLQFSNTFVHSRIKQMSTHTVGNWKQVLLLNMGVTDGKCWTGLEISMCTQRVLI